VTRGDNRVPPHNIPAEQSVLGAILLQPASFDVVLERGLDAGDFYHPDHQRIYATMAALARRHEPLDPISVGEEMRRLGFLDDVGLGNTKGMAYLHDLAVSGPSLAFLQRHTAIVQHGSVIRKLINAASEIAEIAYLEPDDLDHALTEAAARVGNVIADADTRLLRGYHDDILAVDPGGDRDEAQPWIARGLLRRQQRLLVVAKGGLGKSVFLRQLAMCATAGVHPLTGQPTERERPALVVELEASEWDITQSVRTISLAIQRARSLPSLYDAPRPALLHQAGGIDIREPLGFAKLENAIRRAQPELVVMGPVKYLSIAKSNENYEIAALRLMNILNDLIARYRFALVMEVHFSRGDHGAPGGSERWVDWPDAGFGIHPPDDDVTKRLAIGGAGVEMTVKQFRTPRDSAVWLPSTMIRGADKVLPWSVPDTTDPYRSGSTIFATRYGGVADRDFTPYVQEEF
jgi:replicative DNA helicase